MSRRDRPVFEGHARRGIERHHSPHRRHDIVMHLLKVAAFALVLALVIKIIRADL